jgi:DNA-binding NtrC family response regulator
VGAGVRAPRTSAASARSLWYSRLVTRPSGVLTIPHGASGIPIRTLRVEVTEGPDAGQVHLAETDSVTVGAARGNDVVLTDTTVSRFHLELTRRPDGILVVDAGSMNGTFAGGTRLEKGVIAPGTLLRLGTTSLRVGEGEAVTLSVPPTESLGGVRGRTPAMRRLMGAVEKAARSDIAVLCVGESGTGKELIARALHDLGPRASGPLVTVDCGSLAPTLVASELFGHERGAFTGADRQHAGAFERASGGTLFLDEIGELPPPLQATLLGVLERRRFRRLGGTKDISVDVRVVSATHRDLRAEVNAGTFRLDLYYRLAVVTVRVPPLRERPDDIPLLVEHFLREAGHDGPIEELVSPQAMQGLLQHHWPGNVRELRNLLEATMAMGETPSIDGGVGGPPPAAGDDPISQLLELPYKDARATLLHGFEARYLARLLARSGGNVSRAARDARMDRSHLIDLLAKHKLKA